VGSSNSGKSAILRALNWTINNKPSGDSFRSNWGGNTEISVCFDDKNIVDRIKTDKENIYMLKEMEFRSFGQDVPEEIRQVINMTDVNFQYQMDAPFLLSRTPGEVARYLNKIVNLDEIDLSLSSISSLTRKLNQELQFSQSQHEELLEQEKRYDWIDSAEKELTKAENLQIELEGLRKEKEDISYLIREIGSAKQEKEKVSEILKAKRLLNSAIKMDEDLMDMEDKLDSLYHIMAEITEIRLDMKEWNHLLESKNLWREAYELSEDISIQKSQLSDLEGLSGEIDYAWKDLVMLNTQIERWNKEFKDMMSDICPLCKQEIKERRIS